MNGRPVKVLLVEDNEDDYLITRNLLSELEAGEFSLRWVSSYEDALRALQHSRPDICLVDYNLGPRSGLDLLAEARANGFDTPMLLLTAYASRKVDLEALKAGAAGYLVKGQTNSHLLERSIRYAIERSRLEQQKADFITLTSHELRTPLTSIKGFLHLAKRTAQGQADKTLLHYLDVIQQQTDRLTKLVDDLLDVSRTYSGSIPFSIERVVLQEVIESVVNSMRWVIPHFEFALELPHDPIFVKADRQRTEQVLSNLLDNAVKYSGESRRVEVSANISPSGTEAVVTVRDFGIGIVADQQEKIFERFYRGAGAGASSRSGLGVGLAIAQEIVQQQGGQILCESVRGEGSTFRFTLPLADT